MLRWRCGSASELAVEAWTQRLPGAHVTFGLCWLQRQGQPNRKIKPRPFVRLPLAKDCNLVDHYNQHELRCYPGSAERQHGRMDEKVDDAQYQRGMQTGEWDEEENTRKERLEVSAIGFGCMGLNFGYGHARGKRTR